MRYFLVDLNTMAGEEKLQVTKKQLVWLLYHTNLENFEILAVPSGQCKGEYLDSYERKQMRDSA